MSTDASPNPAVQTAKYLGERDREERIHTLRNGVRVKVFPVSATLIDEVVSRVEDPEVPIFHNPDKDRDEPNPNDPQYLKALAKADKQRGIAAMDAMVMFGVQVVDGIPAPETWLTKLQMMDRMKRLDLSVYDLTNEIDVEFLYKRYILADAELLDIVGKESGMIAEDVERAERSFPSD